MALSRITLITVEEKHQASPPRLRTSRVFDRVPSWHLREIISRRFPSEIGSGFLVVTCGPISQNIALELLCERCAREEAPQARMRRPIGSQDRSTRDSLQLDRSVQEYVRGSPFAPIVHRDKDQVGNYGNEVWVNTRSDWSSNRSNFNIAAGAKYTECEADFASQML